jgi:outer membrane protein with beta-barrel domain
MIAARSKAGRRDLEISMKCLLGIVCCVLAAAAAPAYAQSWEVEVSGGSATPVSDIGSRLSTGWNFDFAAGRQLTGWLSLLGDFGFAAMPVPASVLQEFNAPVGRGRIITLALDPEVRFPLGKRLRGFAMGGAGWVHRAVDLTAPSVQYVDYYDPFYGDLGPQPIEGDQVISSVTRNGFGENVGAGVSYPVTALGAELFAAVRYYRAPTSPRITAMVPVMFGLRWIPKSRP